ncbi:MAG: PQQ-dependent sugar dehydrogenase [Fibrobacteria bacterium]
MFRISYVLATLTAACLSISSASAQIPDGITLTPAFGTDGANNFSLPTLMAEVPGKPGTFLVPEMATGKIWILAPGDSGFTKTQFGQAKGHGWNNDMGLVGFAFHPDYANNRKYYVKRGNQERPPRQMFIEEGIAAADYLHDSGQPLRMLMTVDLPNEFHDHNGGSPVFGPDGYLYLSIGDGGWDDTTPDPFHYGQNRESLLGKMLRIDVDHKDPGLEYAIPKDNPFVDDANPKVRREIWAYGLRNSYRFAFDRLTGELYDGDVGWIKFEEIDIIKKGANYGWSLKEGAYCLPDGPCDGVTTPIEEPLAALVYGGAPGQAKCVIGGQVYRGDPASPFYGVYLFGDHSLKKLFALKKPASGPATVKEYPLVVPQEPLAFTLDNLNNLYLIGFGGTIYKLNHADLIPMATITSIRPGAKAAVASRGMRSMVLLSDRGRLTLPAGLEGDWEAVTPAGTRLGILGPHHGSVKVMGKGLVLLRPVDYR